LLFLKYFGFVEVLYILYSFFYPSLEADLGFSLSERAQRIIYYFHRGFWFWLWIWVFAVAPKLFGYMLMRKKVSSKGYTPRRRRTAAQSRDCSAEAR